VSIGTPGAVSITIRDEIMLRGAIKLQAICAIKDALEHLKVCVERGIHEQIDLLDIICEVWPSKSEILKSSGEAAIFGEIRKWFAVGRGMFSTSGNRCRDGVVV